MTENTVLYAASVWYVFSTADDRQQLETANPTRHPIRVVSYKSAESEKTG